MAGASLAALAVAEIGLRVLDLPRDSGTEFLAELALSAEFTADPELFWRLNPATMTFEVNALGLRGDWPSRPRESGEILIACVGDSCTFGTGVRYGETYGMRLERMLQRDHPQRGVSTILAALPGYSTHQSLALYRRHIAPLRPDWTVLYAGAWNDYAPAVGQSDAAKARDRARLRLHRVLARWWDPPDTRTASREEYIAAAKTDRPIDGRRVPLDDFRANLVALVESARSGGSRVLAVVPPLPPTTLADYPASREYRAALRAVYDALHVPVVDAGRRFDEFSRGCPETWRGDESGLPIGFRDWVHPSAKGHELLAGELAELLRVELGARADHGPAKPLAVDIDATGMPEIVALSTPRLRFPLAGLPTGWPAERAWLGTLRVAGPAVEPDGSLVFALPRGVPPGDHTLFLTGPRGLAQARQPVRVTPLPLRVAAVRRGEVVALDLSLEGPPGWHVGVWISATRLEPPVATRFGPLFLDHAAAGRPADRPDLPFRFDRMVAPPFGGTIDASGRWHARAELPAPAQSTAAALFFQAVVRESGHRIHGATTEVVRTQVP